MPSSPSALHRRYKSSPALQLAYRWVVQLLDPVRLVKAVPGFVRYLGDWRRYSRLPGAERLAWSESHPVLAQATEITGYDAHYVHQAVWAMRLVTTRRPARHVDISSDHRFVTMLSPIVPVLFIDYRPLQISLPNFESRAGDVLDLPFESGSLDSVSCLHVIEHVGLGRYGDPLNPAGTRLACAELARVLAPGGELLLSTPVGRARTAFNGHRVSDPAAIAEYMPELQLQEFAAVLDDASFAEAPDLELVQRQEYACGLYRFTKPG